MGRPPVRYCVRGHDTDVCGRQPRSHVCRECEQERADAAKRGEKIAPAHVLTIPFYPMHSWIVNEYEVFTVFTESTQRKLWRWNKQGYIPLYAADEFCCQTLGVHPSAVFGDFWFSFGEEQTA